MKIYLQQSIPENQLFTVHDEFWNHYVTTVRRVREGDSLEIVGNGMVGKGTVRSTDPLTVAIDSTRPANQPSYNLMLCQAISRKSSFDDIVHNVSDLGVTEIIPVITERTVRRPNQPEKMRDRWRRIILDSSRISNRDWLTNIHPIMDWEESLEFVSEKGSIYWGDAGGGSPADVYGKQGEHGILFIGPEGGFTSQEKNALGARAEPVSLGTENYRAGTAAMICSTLWLYHYRVL